MVIFLGYGEALTCALARVDKLPHTIYTNQNHKNHTCRTKRTKKYKFIFFSPFFFIGNRSPMKRFFHWVPFPNEAIFHWGTSPNVIGNRSPMRNSKKPVFMRVYDFSVLYITILPFSTNLKFGVQYGFQVKNNVL